MTAEQVAAGGLSGYDALLGPEVGVARTARAGSTACSAREARAQRAAARLSGTSSDIRLAVRASSGAQARAVLDRFGAEYRAGRSGSTVAFVIANPRELTADQHPFAGRLPSALEQAGVATIAYRAP